MKTARVIAIILIILSVLTVASVITAKIYEARLGPILLKNINAQLNSDIIVKDVKFSVLKKFPNASFELKDVYLKSQTGFLTNNEFRGFNTDTLLNASKIFLEFNVIDLIKKHYNIKSIEVNQAAIKILIDKNGLENYMIWINKEILGEELSVNLKNVSINNVELLFVNQFKNYHVKTRIIHLDIQGNFKKDSSKLIAKGNMLLKNLKINEMNYRVNRKSSFHFNVFKESGKFHFHDSNIKISGVKFNISGEYINNKKQYCDIKITTDNTELNSLIHLFPGQYLKKLKNYSVYGDFSFVTYIKGPINKRKNPNILIKFNLAEGSLLNNKTNIILSNLSLNGKFTNGSSNTLVSSSIDLRDVSFNIDSSSFSGNYFIYNFEHPTLKIQSEIDISLSQIQEFFQFDTISKATGKLRSTFWFDGKFENIRKPNIEEIKNIKLSGESNLKNASLGLKGSKHIFSNINAKMVFADNDIRISTLSFNDADNKFHVEGLLINYIPYLLFEGSELFLDANIHSSYLDMENYILISGEKTNEDSTHILFPDDISFSIGLDISNFSFSKFKAQNLKSMLHYKDSILTADNISFNTMTGSVTGTWDLSLNQERNIELKLNSKLENIDINKLFYSFNNFGQKFIVDENLNGNLNGTIKFSGTWDKKLNIIPEKIFSKCDININKGELVDFEPMQSLSRFADVEELKYVQFSELHNTIYIKDKKVIIPDMQIISSAFNLGISGEHTFNNEIDYHLNLLLSEVLSSRFKKRKKKDGEFTNIEDDELGRTTLFIAITGTVDDYKLSYDRKKARKKLKQDFEEEKEEIKEILKDEFSLFKKDSTKKKIRQTETESGGFIFEFEEDTL